MVKAATEIQEMAEEAGVDAGPIEGFMRSIFGKKATSAAVGVFSWRSACSTLSSEPRVRRDRSRRDARSRSESAHPSAPESYRTPRSSAVARTTSSQR